MVDDVDRAAFLREYSRALEEDRAALFVGAGLSVASGYVDWRGLLRSFAQELGLDIEQEFDLPAIAQYHIEANNDDRSRLYQHLRNEFEANATQTRSQLTIARLPIRHIWTTNYDAGLERALQAAGVNADVKPTGRGAAWATSAPAPAVAVYKMHGDIGDPDNIVLSRDDYDRYAANYPWVFPVLQAHLTERSFLFLGFSFTDPNFDHVLARLRQALGSSQRSHWAIMKRDASEPDATRQRLRVRSLRRYGIHVLLVDEYDEVPEVLEELERRLRRRHVLVSGAAADSAPLGDRLEPFAVDVGRLVIDSGRHLVSGLGLGIGSAVLTGAAAAVYEAKSDPQRRLRLRPFPRNLTGPAKAEMHTKWRRDMISIAGIAIFISGNRLDDSGTVVNSPGVFEEFDLAVESGCYPLPIGATGWASLELFNRVTRDPVAYLPDTFSPELLTPLGDADATDADLVRALKAAMDALTPPG